MSLLAVGDQIAARLRERLSGVAVLTAATAGDLTKGKQLAPAVYVIYAGGSVPESRPDGLAARIGQRWLTVVSARHVGDVVGGGPARDAAGALADQVLDALMGWQPPGTTQPLRLADLPDPGYVTGFQLVPLAFSTELVRRNTPA